MNLSGKNILVTGAAGFIGSHLVEQLLVQDYQVRAFIRYNSRNDIGWLTEIAERENSNLEIIAGDLKDSDAVRAAAKGCKIVFHLGALIGIPFSYTNPRDYVDTNIIGTTNVLSAVRNYEIEKVIIVSTSEVYGSAQYIPIDENHPKVAQSPYSASKIAADMLAESYYRSFSLPIVIIRPFNTYGPRQSQRAIMPTIINQLLRDSEVRLGSLAPTRDFTYVTDTVAGLIAGAKCNKAIGRTINLGSGSEISVGELVDRIATIIGVKAKPVCDSKRLRPVDSEVERLLSNNQLAAKLLDWQPQVSLDDGLEKTIAWFTKNQAVCRSEQYVK